MSYARKVLIAAVLYLLGMFTALGNIWTMEGKPWVPAVLIPTGLGTVMLLAAIVVALVEENPRW